MPDPFVLAVKSSFLLGNAGRFTHEWTQRDIVPGDDKVGLTWPSYIKLTRDIAAFQYAEKQITTLTYRASLPVSLRAVYRLVDAGDLSGFNADLLSVHIYPNVALAVINEPFVDWDSPADSEQLRTIQKAFEAVTGVLHLVPTQLDVSLIFSPLLTFSLFTIGRFVVRFIVRARKLEQFSSAMRWRTDYLCIINREFLLLENANPSLPALRCKAPHRYPPGTVPRKPRATVRIRSAPRRDNRSLQPAIRATPRTTRTTSALLLRLGHRVRPLPRLISSLSLDIRDESECRLTRPNAREHGRRGWAGERLSRAKAITRNSRDDVRSNGLH